MFYSCFYQFEPFVHFHRVEYVHYVGFADWRKNGFNDVKHISIEMEDTEVCVFNFIHFVLGIELKHGFLAFFRVLHVNTLS